MLFKDPTDVSHRKPRNLKRHPHANKIAWACAAGTVACTWALNFFFASFWEDHVKERSVTFDDTKLARMIKLRQEYYKEFTTGAVISQINIRDRDRRIEAFKQKHGITDIGDDYKIPTPKLKLDD